MRVSLKFHYYRNYDTDVRMLIIQSIEMFALIYSQFASNNPNVNWI